MQKGIYRGRELIVEWQGYATGVARENGQLPTIVETRFRQPLMLPLLMSMFFQSNET
jgi:hypothetical protein